jgi:hypothetical protein
LKIYHARKVNLTTDADIITKPSVLASQFSAAGQIGGRASSRAELLKQRAPAQHCEKTTVSHRAGARHSKGGFLISNLAQKILDFTVYIIYIQLKHSP